MNTLLKNLTIKNNFMFAAVMSDEENCKGFLERALSMKVDHVEISTEKNIVYHPEYKGVRLDVYAKDENNTRYNIEMQVLKQSALGRRSRYYQSQMDMELLAKGCEYAELPDSYVIFLCDFDPFGEGKYRYTFRTACEETKKVSLKHWLPHELLGASRYAWPFHHKILSCQTVSLTVHSILFSENPCPQKEAAH